MAKSGRPSAITDEIGQTIAVIRDRHPEWSFRAIQSKIPDFYRVRFKHSFTGKIPSLNPIVDFIHKDVDPGRIKIAESGIEKIWSSAALINESISPVVLHLLILVQWCRKRCYSKLLTIREARWFNNLSGFQGNCSYPPDMIMPELKNMFLSLKIATWAQMYAYREKIDTMAGIKEPDFSELDNSIVTGSLHEIFKHNSKWANDRLSPVFDDENATKDALKEAYFSDLKPALFEAIREAETSVLGHSLGDPDMPENSILLYGNALGTLFAEGGWNSHLEKINYQQKLNFLCLVREWCKNNPDLEPDFDYSNPDEKKKYDSVISNIFANVNNQPESSRL